MRGLKSQKLPKKSRVGRGRPRVEGVVATLKDAAARLELPVDLLRMARGAGCTAFRKNGTVSTVELKEWFAKNPTRLPNANALVDKIQWDAEDKKAIAEMRQHKLAVMRRDVIPVAEVKLKFTRAVLDAKKGFTEAVRTLMQEVTLHCGASEAQIAWAMAQGEKRVRDVLTVLAGKEFCGVTCPKCKEEIK